MSASWFDTGYLEMVEPKYSKLTSYMPICYKKNRMSNLQVIDQMVLWNHDKVLNLIPLIDQIVPFLVLIAECLPILGSQQLKQPMQGEKLSCNGNDTVLLSLPNVIPCGSVVVRVIALLVGDRKIVLSLFHGSLSPMQDQVIAESEL